jgi:hypothetical protein
VCREERATRFFEKEEKEEQEQVEEQEEVYPHLRHVDSRQILQAIPFSFSPFFPLIFFRNFSFSFSFTPEDSPEIFFRLHARLFCFGLFKRVCSAILQTHFDWFCFASFLLFLDSL